MAPQVRNDVERRADSTVSKGHPDYRKRYTKNEFKRYYGKREGLRKWDTAGRYCFYKPKMTKEEVAPAKPDPGFNKRMGKLDKQGSPATPSTCGLTVSTAPVVIVQQPVSACSTPELRSWLLVEAEKELDEAEAQLELLKRELAAERERRCAAEQRLIDKDEEAQRLRSALALQGSQLEQAEDSLLELRAKAHSRREEARRAQWALHQIKQEVKMTSEQMQQVTADAVRELQYGGGHGELRQQIECCGGERETLESPQGHGAETELGRGDTSALKESNGPPELLAAGIECPPGYPAAEPPPKPRPRYPSLSLLLQQ